MQMSILSQLAVDWGPSCMLSQDLQLIWDLRCHPGNSEIIPNKAGV